MPSMKIENILILWHGVKRFIYYLFVFSIPFMSIENSNASTVSVTTTPPPLSKYAISADKENTPSEAWEEIKIEIDNILSKSFSARHNMELIPGPSLDQISIESSPNGILKGGRGVTIFGEYKHFPAKIFVHIGPWNKNEYSIKSLNISFNNYDSGKEIDRLHCIDFNEIKGDLHRLGFSNAISAPGADGVNLNKIRVNINSTNLFGFIVFTNYDYDRKLSCLSEVSISNYRYGVPNFLKGN